MSWQLFALACSLSFAVQNVLIKYLSRRNVGSMLILLFLFIAAVPVLYPLYAGFAPHAYEGQFPLVMVFAVGGNLLAFFGYVRAIELADVSLVSPLLSLSPFFMLLTSWVILSEFPDVRGLLGVLAVVVGTYFLAGGGWSQGLKPLRTLWEEPGTRWALFVSFLWSIQANIDKLGVQASNPIAYAYWFHVLFSFLFVPFYLVWKRPFRSGGEAWDLGRIGLRTGMVLAGFLVLGGVLQAVMSATQMVAVIRTDVTYVIAIKRSGMLVSVLLGGWLFAEPRTRQRFLAAALVFAGLTGILFR